MRRQRWLTQLVLFGLAALSWSEALALTDEEIFRSFQFNFINPGARAVGLGGAFIAAADDATAAQANPAALHYVFKSEFFAEYRLDRPASSIVEQSQGSDDPTNNLDLPFLNATLFNDPEDRSNVSFLSFVFPFDVNKARLRLALSRQVVLDVKSSLGPKDATTLKFAAETFPIWVNPDGGQVERYTISNDATGDLDAEIIHYNLGFSTSVTPDFSVGLTATYATLDVKSSVVGTVEDPRGLLSFTNPRLDPDGDGLFAPVGLTTAVDGSDSAWTYTFGVHWHPDLAFPSGVSPLRMGFVYRHGAKLEVEEVVHEGGTEVDRFANVFKVPDRFGIGASYDLPRWTFALDVERIQYSDLLEGFKPGVNFFTSGTIGGQDLGFRSNATPADFKYDVDDATVVHAGVEYNIASRGHWSHALRLGYYNAPDNRIRMTDLPTETPEGDKTRELYLDVFGGGEDDDHYTVGFTVQRTPPSGSHFVFSVAGDFADAGDAYVASLLWRFGK